MKEKRTLAFQLCILAIFGLWGCLEGATYQNVFIKNNAITISAPLTSNLLQSLSAPTPQGVLYQGFGQTGSTQAGTAYINFFIAGGNSDQAGGLAVQPDGKLVMGGHSVDENGHTRYAVARFLPNGQLDTTFGQTGTSKAGTAYVNFSIAGGTNDEAYALALQSDGKIVLGGWGFNGDGHIRYTVARFLPNGQLDLGFGRVGTPQAGTACINFSIAGGNDDEAYTLALQSDGKLVLGGYSADGNGHTRYSLARLLSNGSLDTEFGQVGTPQAGTAYVTGNIAGGTNDKAYALVVQPDGKLVLGGWSLDVNNNQRYSIARILPNGQLDTTFGQAGTAYINFSIIFGDDKAFSLALQSDGKLVLGGWSQSEFGTQYSVARFLSNGSLDTTTFGQVGTSKAGTAYVAFSIAGGNSDQAYALAVQSDGKIVQGGFSVDGGDNTRYAVARFLPNGSLDTGFGGIGTTYIGFDIIPGGGNDDEVTAIAVQSDGSIVLAGLSEAVGGVHSHYSVAYFIAPQSLASFTAQFPSQGGFY